jgi:hypothetical protein
MFANTPTRGGLQHHKQEEEKMIKYRFIKKTIFFSCKDIESLKESFQRENRGQHPQTQGTCFLGL